MSRIKTKFEHLYSKKQKALIGYTMVGYPTQKDTLKIVDGLIQGGVDIIELGFPFSDPLADGPIIQNASVVAMQNGTRLTQFFEIVKKIRNKTDIPLILMTYSNVLYNKGYYNFLKIAKESGIDGVILPDMSIEECESYLDAAKTLHLDTIFLISPNTSADRIDKIIKVSSGFVYLVAIYGVTGAKNEIKDYTIQAIKNIKKLHNIPIAVGFGVSSPQDVEKYVNAGADGVIIGSAFLRLIKEISSDDLEKTVYEFTKKLKEKTIEG